MTSPTAALVRKDGPWLSGLLVLGAVLASAVCGEAGFLRVFVVPERSLAEDLQVALVPLALLLALVSSLHDVLRSTREYVLHRPVIAARVATVRHVAALAVIAGWMVAGACWVGLGELLLGFGGACADPARVALLATVALGLALDYAVVSCALVLPASWFHRVWLAALLLFSRYAVQSWAGAHDPSLASVSVVYALATLLLLVGAVACESAGHDADQPSRGRAFVVAAALAVVTAGFFGAIAAGGWQKLALQGLQAVRPTLGRAGDELALLGRAGRDGTRAVLGPDGEPTARRVEPEHVFLAPKPADPDFDAVRVPALYPPSARYQVGTRYGRRIWTAVDAVHVVMETDDARRCWTLPLPAGSTDVHDAALIELEAGEHEASAFLAPGQGIWLVTTDTPPRLVPEPLPDGEVPLRPISWLEAGGTRYRKGVSSASGAWEHRPGGWKRVDAEWQRQPDLALEVLDPDPLRPAIELRADDGASLRHRYTLARPAEKLFAGFAGLASVLRPPPFALLGARTDYVALATAKQDEALLVLDPLLGGGYRWLLVPNLLLHAVLVALVVRELRARGATRTRVVGWVLAVACAGAFSGPVILALEPKRAWRRPARSTPPPPLVAAA